MRFWKRFAAALMIAAMLLADGAALAEEYPFAAFATATAKIRQRPADTAPLVTDVPEGDAVLVTGVTGDYYIVAYEGKTGYALRKYFSTTGGENVLPEGENNNPVVTDSPYLLLSSGSTGDHVTALQEALKELGFYAGTVDGKFGTGTRSAVLAFQDMNGLYETGTADAATQTLLFEGKPKNSKGKAAAVKTVSAVEGAAISSGSQGTAVKKLQERLKTLGYYKGTVDGNCGSGTVSAVKAFQKKTGLKQTGTADADTQALLYALNAPSAQSTATPKPTQAPTLAPAVTEAPKAADYPFVTYTLASVNLRSRADINSTRILTVPQGDEVTVLAMEGDFVRVTYGSRTGYLMAQYVNIPSQYLPGSDLTADAEARQNYAYLQFGSTGTLVSALQDALQELGFYTGKVDGSFGTATVTALKNFQKQNGLKQDGVASPELQQLLYEGKPKNSKGKKTDVKTLPPIDGYLMVRDDKGEAVRALQTKLKNLGYYTGVLGTLYDAATEKAVKAFQKDHNLTVDGKAGEKTQQLLNLLSATATPAPSVTPGAVTAQPSATPLTPDNVIVMQNGTRGLAVTRLQERLVELGYYTCTPDGIYDSDDIAAVREFQRKNGLKVDGIAGYDTQVRLYSAAAVPAATATPLPAATPTATVGGLLPNQPAATPNTGLTLKIGSEGMEVRYLQERLVVLGFYAKAVDGIFGTGTAVAVTTFQRANGLTADGVAGPKTLTQLYSANAKGPGALATQAPAATAAPTATTLKSGDKGDAVKAMQQRLVTLGYLTAADGIYGPRTYSAVVNFQKRNGLTADGIAGKQTLSRLNSAQAVAASGVTAPTQPSTPSTGTNTGTNTGSTFKAPDASEVRYANWYSEIRDRAKLMPDVIVYDPDSGLHYNLHMFSFGKHVDCEPPTAADTAIMNQVCGENNWTPKYVWVIFSDGRVYIASTHSHGHEVDHTSGNDLTGHICVHFPRVMSEAEATGPYAVSHQKEILWGWELTQAMIR